MADDRQLSKLYGGPLPVEPSIYCLLERGLKRSPNEPAIIVMHQSPTHLSQLTSGTPPSKADCLIWTFEQLHNAALKMVAGLMANGVRHGETLMSVIPSGVEWPIVLWTCAILKLTLLPF